MMMVVLSCMMNQALKMMPIELVYLRKMLCMPMHINVLCLHIFFGVKSKIVIQSYVQTMQFHAQFQ